MRKFPAGHDLKSRATSARADISHRTNEFYTHALSNMHPALEEAATQVEAHFMSMWSKSGKKFSLESHIYTDINKS